MEPMDVNAVRLQVKGQSQGQKGLGEEQTGSMRMGPAVEWLLKLKDSERC